MTPLPTGGTPAVVDEVARALVAGPPPGAEGHPPPGAVVGLHLDGVRTVGVAGRVDGAAAAAPMTRDTRHDLASVTKVVATTAAVLRLADDGALPVGTPVRRILPSYPGDAATTVEDLLRHRAGLWEWQPLYLAPEADQGPAVVLDSLPLRYRPGTARHYSDLGFMHLGRIVASAFGGPLGEAVRTLALDPAGLHATGFGPIDPTGTPVAASAWGDRTEQRMVATGEPYPVLWPPRAFRWRENLLTGQVDDGNCAHAWAGTAGHAGLFGTVDDLLDAALAVARRLAEGDPHGLLDPGPDTEQSLGWRVRTVATGRGPGRLLWHPGFTGCAVGVLPH
ncbi:MAG: beta-lactamase family protein, partial [Actinobacteria bacterium]|nr:beta-lactamase family protein [Actinomycetota bacterium]